MMENKHTIYFNMCHHYRKIFNAKACVDTSPPKALQVKSGLWKFNFRPKSATQETSVKTFQKKKDQLLIKDNDEAITCKYYYQHHKKNVETNTMDKSFVAPQKPFSPAILKSNVQSKVRALRVYYPPRKKRVILNEEESSPSSLVNREDKKEAVVKHHSAVSCDRPKSALKNAKRSSFTVLDRHSYSEESSEDSAYNEGEGVLSSDSRGSTPQNLTKKHQSNTKLSMTENSSISKNTSLSNKTPEEIVYIQFLKDITNDILHKNIFTNKALKSVFQRHVQINKYNLDTEKMLNEINKLQERLGVPKDDKFDDEDYGLGKDVSITEHSNIGGSANNEDTTLQSGQINAQQITSNQETDNETEDVRKNDYSEDFSDDEPNNSADASHTNSNIATEANKEYEYYDNTSDDNEDIVSVNNEQVDTNDDEAEKEESVTEIEDVNDESDNSNTYTNSEISDVDE